MATKKTLQQKVAKVEKLTGAYLVQLPNDIAQHLKVMAAQHEVVRKSGTTKMLRKEYMEKVLIDLVQSDEKYIKMQKLLKTKKLVSQKLFNE